MIRLAADENFNNDIVRGILRRDPTIDIIRVQDAGLTRADDPTVLEWAAQTGRVLLTHDVATITHYAYERVRAGQRMPGVFEVSRRLALSQAIDDIILIAGRVQHSRQSLSARRRHQLWLSDRVYPFYWHTSGLRPDRRSEHLRHGGTMEIHPIKTEADYQAALAEVERLFDAPANTPEGDRLDIFTTLIEAYETQTAPIPAPDPIEAILYHLESRGLARRDLEPYVGGRARVSEILNRKRPLTLEMIRRLHSGLGIPAEVLIQPYSTTKAAA